MPDTIPIAPKPPQTHITPGPAPSSHSGGGGSKPKGGGGGGKGGGSKKAKDPYAAAQARADAKERKDDKRTQQRYLEDARGLNQQVRALTAALGKKGTRAALEQRLANITLDTSQKLDTLKGGYTDRVASLQGAQVDNEKAAASGSYAALSNKGRERVAA